MNKNRIEINKFEDLELLHTITRILNEYHKNPQEYITLTNRNINGEPYTMTYPAARIAKNYERIVKVQGLRGYCVLDDNTILCINSSSFISQYDGCKEEELETGCNNAIKGN